MHERNNLNFCMSLLNKTPVRYCRTELRPDIDFFVYGHRHVALDMQLKNKSRVVILGDFVSIFSYGVFDGENFWLEYVQ
jgi:UDP-2,3-diacylglucosamine hydrolase